MTIAIFFNTDGYLGGWAFNDRVKNPVPLTNEVIQAAKIAAKKQAKLLFVDIDQQDIPFFVKTIQADNVDVLPTDTKMNGRGIVKFGTLVLDIRNTVTHTAKMVEDHKKAIERANKKTRGIKTKHDKWLEEIYEKVRL